jgi:hypothetical protein
MKTTELINSIVENGVITEREINLICRRLNTGEKIDLSLIWDNPVKLTPEQFNKGFTWLKNLYITSAGKERKNNPYGYREIEAIKNPDYMTFDGVFDAGNYNHSFYVPIYSLSAHGSGFQYYVSGGKINIIG